MRAVRCFVTPCNNYYIGWSCYYQERLDWHKFILWFILSAGCD